MFLVVLRSLFFILIIFSIIADIDIPVVLHTPVNQLIIGILILGIIIGIDEILGFLIGLLFLIIYFKYYQKLIHNKTSNSNYMKEPLLEKNNEKFDDVKPVKNDKTEMIENHYIKFSNDCIEMPYISNQLLENAQTNIYDINNYNNEIRTDNNTYGVQGLNSDAIHYPGFDLTTPNFQIYK